MEKKKKKKKKKKDKPKSLNKKDPMCGEKKSVTLSYRRGKRNPCNRKRRRNSLGVKKKGGDNEI